MTTHSTSENPVAQGADGGFSDSSVIQKWQHELDLNDALGLKSQPWKSTETNDTVVLPHLDIDWLIAQPLLPYIVQALPTHLLHRSLQAHGYEDSLEVIDAIRGDALVRLMDYELWDAPGTSDKFLNPEEDLSAERFIHWVKLWNEISPEFAAERLLELDEGVIVGCLTAACEIIPVGLNRKQEELTDDYWMTPDNKFGLKIKTSNEADFEIIHGLVHALYSRDLRLAQKVLSYSAMLIRDEALEEARKWRQGRLEDQGFVPAEEARSLLLPKTRKQVTELLKISMRREQNASAEAKSGASASALVAESPVDEEMIERLRTLVSTMEPDLLHSEIRSLLPEDDIIRLVGTAQNRLEAVVQDEEVLETFVAKVAHDVTTLLVRLESHGAKSLKIKPSKAALLFDRVMAQISEHEPELALEWKSRLARTTNAVSAAFGAAADSAELGRVLSVVRGCLNIGLETLLSEPVSFELTFDAVDCKVDDEAEISLAAVALVRAVGPEALFQVGWQSLQELASKALQAATEISHGAGQTKAGESAEYSVKLADGQVLKLPVLSLLSAGRYQEVRKWLRNAFGTSPALEHVLLSTVNRLPVFPIILLEENGVTSGTTAVKPYESTQEIVIAECFIKNLHALIGATGQED